MANQKATKAKTEFLDTLKELQALRNAWASLGMVPPDVTALIDRIDQAESEIADLQKVKAGLQGEIQKLSGSKADYEAKGREYLAAHNLTIQKLDGERDALQAEVNRLGIEIQELSGTLKAAEESRRAQFSELDKQIEVKQGQLEALKDEINAIRKKFAP